MTGDALPHCWEKGPSIKIGQCSSKEEWSRRKTALPPNMIMKIILREGF